MRSASVIGRNCPTHLLSSYSIATRITCSHFLAHRVSTRQLRHISTVMASPRKPEWLCIIPDFPNILDKRMEVRSKHFEGLQGKPYIKFGGGMLDVPVSEGDGLKLKGSAVTVEADTREETIEILKQDIYATSGVWDVENATIIPFVTGVRKPM